MKSNYFILIAGLFFFLISCATTQNVEKTSNKNDGNLSAEEISFILSEKNLKVFKNNVEDENNVLRKVSKKALINSDDYDVLEENMMTILLEEKGVGIAAPQIGINRRVIIVQRLDKEDKPFEFYYNPVITNKRGELIEGWEGCLSVPDGFGKVLRHQDIDVEYDKKNNVGFERIAEKIEGWTAVIFQHEIDHLDGVLFIDKKCEGDLVPKEKYYEMKKKQKEEKETLNETTGTE